MKKILFSLALLFSFLTLVKAENILKIYVERPKEAKGTIVYQITHKKSGLVENVEVDGNYKEVVCADDEEWINVIEVERPSYFETNTNVYNYHFREGYTPELKVQVKLKNILFKIKTNYYSLKDNQEKESYRTSFKLLDENQEFLKDINYNTFLLEYGNYYLQDVSTLKIYSFDYQNTEIIAYRYLIDGLKVNTKVASICQNDKSYEFSQEGENISFKEELYPGTYTINGKEYNIIENPEAIQNDKLNIIYLDDVPVLEEEKEEPEEKEPDLSKPDEKPEEKDDPTPVIPEEEQKPDLPPEDEEEINDNPDKEEDSFEEVKDYDVEVPNTGISTNEIIYYLDKKYFL